MLFFLLYSEELWYNSIENMQKRGGYNDQRNKGFVFMLGGDLYDNLI